MSNHLPSEFKQIVFDDLQAALDEVQVFIDLGGDDEAHVEAVMNLLLKAQACGRRLQEYHPDLHKLWGEVAKKKGYVGPNDETRPMERDAIQAGFLGEQAALEEEEVCLDSKVGGTLELLVRDVPAAARKPETSTHSTILESVTSGPHKRPEAS